MADERTGIKYIGKEPYYKDRIFGTGLVWKSGEALPLAVEVAKEFLKHPTLFQEVKGLTPLMGSTSSSGEIEDLVSVGPNLERRRHPRHVELMRQDFDFRRRGAVGVGPNKAAIAVRFDDWQSSMKSSIRPLMLARQIPFSLVLISRWRTAVAWGAGATPDDLMSWVSYGAEVFCHGFDHQDYIGYDGLYGNVVTAKKEIEDVLPTVRVQGFSIPGVDTTYGAEGSATPVTPEQRGSQYPYDQLNQPQQWYGPAGRLLMSHYALVESDSGPVRLPIGAAPNLYMYGRAHLGLDFVTLGQAKDVVDQAVRERCSLRIMGHPGNFGTARAKMTVAEFTSFLDYMVTLRDAGLLEFVMPSSLPYVTNSTQRLDLMSGWGTLVGATNTSLSGWYKLGGAYNTISPNGGHNDLPYCQIDASGGLIYSPSYLVSDATKQGFAGETFEFRGWAQSVDASNTSARIDIVAAGTTWTVGKTFVVGPTLTLVRFQFTLPKVGPNGEFIGSIDIKPSRYGGSGIRWSDMSCVKI